MIRAICIGEAMVELRPLAPDTLARSVAGDAYNTAVYLKRCLGAEADVAFLSVVGDDPLSQALIEDFERQSIETGLMMVKPGGVVGLYLIDLDSAGDRRFFYWRSESAARGWMSHLDAAGGVEMLAGADLVFLSGISLAVLPPADRSKALRLLAALRGKVGRVAFSLNVRPRLWPDAGAGRTMLKSACAIADLVLASDADSEWLWGVADPRAQIELYRGLGSTETVVTLGADGVLVDCRGVITAAPSAATKVVDTSGAGDSFAAAYLAARIRGAAANAAALQGQALAARVVAAHGALIGAELSHPAEAAAPYRV
jgi:2-dehydro-3-deoxygluconokinase